MNASAWNERESQTAPFCASADQERVVGKEVDHPREWGVFLEFRKLDSFDAIKSSIGGSPDKAATNLQSFMDRKIDSEFGRQQSYWDYSGRHNVPVKFLDE